MNTFLFVLYVILICGASQIIFQVLNDYYQSIIYTTKEKYNTIRNMYAIKDRLISLPNVDRVMIFQQVTARDGVYIKSLYGTSKYKREWAPTSVDGKYLEIMNHIESNKSCYEFITDKEEDSWLKSIYKREGVKYSKIYYVIAKRERQTLIDLFFFRKPKKLGFYYVSVANKTGDKFSEDTEIKIKNDLLNMKYNLKYE